MQQVWCYVPVIQSDSLDCIDTVIELIPSSEHDTKTTTAKTCLLMKVGEVSGQHQTTSAAITHSYSDRRTMEEHINTMAV